VSPVKYELGFLSQKTTFFIVTAVKTSSLTTTSNFVPNILIVIYDSCSPLLHFTLQEAVRRGAGRLSV
jgi:hypothetical protein